MVPIYEQIVDQIKTLIRNGELKENDILPSVRTLSKELKISSLTVKKAYDNLESEGFTVTVHGKGTYVAATNTERLLEEQKKEVDVGAIRAHDQAANTQGGGTSYDSAHVEGIPHGLQKEQGCALLEIIFVFHIYYNRIVGFVNIFCDGYDPVGGIFLRNFFEQAILHPENRASRVG